MSNLNISNMKYNYEEIGDFIKENINFFKFLNLFLMFILYKISIKSYFYKIKDTIFCHQS